MQNNCHLSKLILEQAKKYGDRAALSYRDYDLNKWVPVSWKEFALNVQKVSFALLRLGVGVQENIAVFSQNKPETHYVDFGAYGIRAVAIPFYATSSAAQIIYSFPQCPSTIDINNAGQFTHYVFGRSDSNVYVYTSAGIQAVIPLKYFVKPKQR